MQASLHLIGSGGASASAAAAPDSDDELDDGDGGDGGAGGAGARREQNRHTIFFEDDGAREAFEPAAHHAPSGQSPQRVEPPSDWNSPGRQLSHALCPAALVYLPGLHASGADERARL